MLNWIRDKFFKRPSSSGSENSATTENQSNIICGTSQDSNMFAEPPTHSKIDTILLKIICEGDTWLFNTDCYKGISDLTTLAISHFYNPTDSIDQTSKYKMICLSNKKVLNSLSTVKDEQLRNGDEIMLVHTISTGAALPLQLSIQDIKGPTKEMILEATANLPVKNPIQIVPALDCQDNFQSEIRKVLYSLVEASARILAQSPDAKLVFDDIAVRINVKNKKEIDKSALKNLKELGFTEAQAKYALRLKRNRQVEAMEWLLENSHRVREDEEDDSYSATSSNVTQTTPRDPDPLYTIHQLLNDIQQFHLRHFEPHPTALDKLKEMGFNEAEAIEALRITGNNQVAASEWLCGDRDPNISCPEPGLDTDGPLYKALINNPAIQLGLHNPKVMLAFLSILENPTSANLWLSDVDTAPVLGHVFKTYHSEKHILVVNQQMELMRRQV